MAAVAGSTVLASGVAMVEVVTSTGTVHLMTGIDTRERLGQKIRTEDLIKTIEHRNRSMKGKAEVSCDHDTTQGEYKVMDAAYLLGEVREPEGFSAVLTLAEDPYFLTRGWAVSSLRAYGDRRSLPTLLTLLKERKSCNGALVPTISELGDDTAVVPLIDSIPAGGGCDSEARLKAIESITGLSLAEMREQWGLLYYGDKLGKFHKAMYMWWNKNKANSKNARTAEQAVAGYRRQEASQPDP